MTVSFDGVESFLVPKWDSGYDLFFSRIVKISQQVRSTDVSEHRNLKKWKYISKIWFFNFLFFFTLVTISRTDVHDQETLYTRESYGNICAVVNLLYNRLLVQWKQNLYSDKIIKPTVGWQLHIRYHRLLVYEDFPACTLFRVFCQGIFASHFLLYV